MRIDLKLLYQIFVGQVNNVKYYTIYLSHYKIHRSARHVDHFDQFEKSFASKSIVFISFNGTLVYKAIPASSMNSK